MLWFSSRGNLLFRIHIGEFQNLERILYKSKLNFLNLIDRCDSGKTFEKRNQHGGCNLFLNLGERDPLSPHWIAIGWRCSTFYNIIYSKSFWEEFNKYFRIRKIDDTLQQLQDSTEII